MSLILPFPLMSGSFVPTGDATVDQFSPTTVHSDSVHNNPHAKLLANDVALKNELDTVASSNKLVNVSIGTIVNSGYTYTYQYDRLYTPISLAISSGIVAGGNARELVFSRWRDSAGATIVDWRLLFGINQHAAGDGGAGLNDVFFATTPFFENTIFIDFQLTSAGPLGPPSGVPSHGWSSVSFLRIISVLEQR